MSSTRTSRRGRRLGLFILAALITLVLLYSAYWLLFGVYLRAQTETWIDSRRNAGYVIDYDDLDVGGYPTTVRLSFTRPAMTAPPHDGGWSWSAAGLDISTSPFIWTRSTIEVLGDHTMEFTTTIGRVAARGRADAFMIETDAGGPLPAGDLHIRDWTLQTANGESMTLAALDASGRNISDASDDAYPDATYALTASAATLKLPAQYDLPLGNEIQAVAFNSLLIGHLDPRRWPEGLMRWRDNGGIWEIMRLAATHGPLSFAGSGTVALDAAAQPAGAFTFE
ncbi:MAG: DUF2125 domain-containing protein, partial [Rhodospirillales bacterium]|nr:DUF2125 domain-containing protein [Rhodospirillales bacterium]